MGTFHAGVLDAGSKSSSRVAPTCRGRSALHSRRLSPTVVRPSRSAENRLDRRDVSERFPSRDSSPGDALGVSRRPRPWICVFQRRGKLRGVDALFPTTRSGGKPSRRGAATRIATLADGAGRRWVSDLEAKPVVDQFVASGVTSSGQVKAGSPAFLSNRSTSAPSSAMNARPRLSAAVGRVR